MSFYATVSPEGFMRVFVPHQVQIVHKGRKLVLEPGVQNIPNELANQQWLTALGVAVIRPTLHQPL
jgi:virulence-associated protein VagC